MSKKKNKKFSSTRSSRKFVQEQNYNIHLNDKRVNSSSRRIRQGQRNINAAQEEYEQTTREIYENFLNEFGLNASEVPSNSRILIYELLRKRVSDRRGLYEKYISEHPDDEHIDEVKQAIKTCMETEEDIKNIYTWQNRLEDIVLTDEDRDNDTVFNDVIEIYNKLNPVDNKKKEINDIYEIFNFLSSDSITNIISPDFKEKLIEDFYKFTKYVRTINMEETTKHFFYVEGVLESLDAIRVNDDPIKEIMFKPYIIQDVKPSDNIEGVTDTDVQI